MNWVRVSVCFGLAWCSMVSNTETAQAILILAIVFVTFPTTLKVTIVNDPKRDSSARFNGRDGNGYQPIAQGKKPLPPQNPPGAE